MDLRKKRDVGDQSEDLDPAAEMLEWAKERIGTVSESVPGRMGPPAVTETKREPDRPSSESLPSEAEPPRGTGPKPEPKLLVLAFHEGTTDWAQAHLLADNQEAGRFIETLVDNGLAPARIAVFWGTPMNVNVTYRAAVAIEQPEEEPP